MRVATAAVILLATLLAGCAITGEGEVDSEAPDPPGRGEWLNRHQDEDGSWDPVRFDRHCEESGPCDGAGLAEDRVGLTGLVLLDYLGYGETHKSPRYGMVVRRTLRWFMDRQRDSGSFEPATGDRFVLNHARATLALADLYAATQSPLVKGTARRAVEFLQARRMDGGAWPAGAEGTEADLETSAWAVMAIVSARDGGLEAGVEPWAAVRGWLNENTDPETGRFGPPPARGSDSAAGNGAPPPGPPETATAMALWMRILMAGTEPDPAVEKGVALLHGVPPDPGPRGEALDLRYVYFGSLALQRCGGAPWTRWCEAVKRAVFDTQCQVRAPCTYGSWNATPSTAAEGRVGSTAFGILALQIYYRYSRWE